MESIGKYLRDPTIPSASKPPKPSRPYPGILQALGLILLLGLVEVVFMGLAGGFNPKADLESPRFAIYALVSFGIVLAYGLKKTKALFWEVFPLTRVGSSLYFPLALCVLGMLAITHNVEHFIYITDPPPAFIRNLFPRLLRTGGYWNAFFQLVVVAPLTEEFFCRGLILRGFIKRYGTVTGVTASAALFGALHGNLWQALLATFAGLLLAWWAVETRSLLPCLFGHACWNALVLILFTLPHQWPNTLLGKMLESTGFMPPWLILAGAFIFGVGMYMLARRFQGKESPAGAGATA